MTVTLFVAYFWVFATAASFLVTVGLASYAGAQHYREAPRRRRYVRNSFGRAWR